MTYVSEIRDNIPKTNQERNREVFYTSIVFGCKVLVAVFETKTRGGETNNYMTTENVVDFFVFNGIGAFNKWQESEDKGYPSGNGVAYDEFLNEDDAKNLEAFFASVQDLIVLKQTY